VKVNAVQSQNLKASVVRVNVVLNQNQKPSTAKASAVKVNAVAKAEWLND
jgi:hypothetical protein